jgi:Fe-S oxidoreductase
MRTFLDWSPYEDAGKLLKLLSGRKFSFIDAGCCGMAGTFGLEAEHAKLSLAMAEDALLPSLREAPDAEVVANGFCCRQQISAQTGRRARHLALVLRDALSMREADG